MLSDSPRFQKAKAKKRSKNAVGEYYSDGQKLEAVKMYVITGSNTAVAAALGINVDTFRRWKTQKWFKDLVEDMKHESSIKLSSKLKEIALKSMTLVEDRLENGDYVLDPRTGTLNRKPMNGKDAARIASDFVQQSVKLESRPREEESAVVGRLEDLAKRFEELAQKKTPVQVTDVIFNE